jgi:hypothetical protein
MTSRICAALLCFVTALLTAAAALAEGCFLIDVDALDMSRVSQSAYIQEYLSSPSQGVRVRKYISDSSEIAARVRLTITQAETSAVVFDKSYGYLSGTFDSGDIYLPYVDNNTIPYIIALNIEDWTYALPFMQLQTRLSGNTGCTYGVRLRDLNPSLTGSWVMGTMLDLDALQVQGSISLPICASNLYIVGQATVSLANDLLTVSLSLNPAAQIELLGGAVYVIGDVAAMTTAEPDAMAQTAYAFGQPVDVGGLRTALLYTPLTLSYSPSGLQEFSYDANSPSLADQWTLWYDNLQNGGASATQADMAIAEPTPEADLEIALAPDENTPSPEATEVWADESTADTDSAILP